MSGASLPGQFAGHVVEDTQANLMETGSVGIKGADSFGLPSVPRNSHCSDGTPQTTPVTVTAATPKSQRVSQRTLKAISSELSERDLEILRSVANFRYLGARQIEALHFVGHASALTGARTARRVLDRLTTMTVLTRLDRRIGGVRAGSASFVYAVGVVGRRLLPDDEGLRRFKEPSPHFLGHTLAVADLAIELKQAAEAGQFELLNLSTEPSCWRDFKRKRSGARSEQSETLKPDLLVVLAARDYEHHWFVEVDLATESSMAVARKAAVYLDYLKCGQEQRRNGVFPRVLFVVPDQRRAELLRGRLNAVEPQLFTVVTRPNAVTMLSSGGEV